MDSYGNGLRGNYVNGNINGIYILFSDNTIISENIVNDNINGIGLISSHDNEISGNNVGYNKGDGIYIEGSNDNSISNNIISYNGHCGLILIRSHFNNIYLNIFIGNDKCIREVECEGNIIENNDCDTEEPAILGYNIFILLGVLAFVAILIIQKIKKPGKLN